LQLGIPTNWEIVQNWLTGTGPVPLPIPVVDTTVKKKCPEILTLDTYLFPAPSKFWCNFPSHPIPSDPETPINCKNFRQIFEERKTIFTHSQKHRATTLLKELESGVTVPLSKTLPGISVPNSISVEAHGEQFTDTLAFWLKSGFVAGPFMMPPLPNFRINQMLAIEQHNKIRIVMNLSGPEGESFNDHVCEAALEKVNMATARLFGYTVVECGRNARMWKYDMENAYKNLPAKPSDFRLQGFTWLGRYFLETRQAFGAKSAVAAFDRLGKTTADLALAACNLSPRLLHRTLDDLPIVTPENSPDGPIFAHAYREVCDKIGVKLAPNCPDFVKAFEDVTEGTVLGIRFHTTDLLWSISPQKFNKIRSHILKPMLGGSVTLLSMQTLMGLLNDFGQMCQFARGFKFHLTNFLAHLSVNPNVSEILPTLAREDLKIWLRMLDSAVHGLPIPHRPTPPSMAALTFVSDAAGARFAKIDGRFIPYGEQGDRGGASISALEDGPIWFYAAVTWPEQLLLHARDSQDHAYGCKSSTLEAIALFLPFLCCPTYILGKEVLLLTDNESIVFGWESKRVPHDESASIMIRCLHVLAHYLAVTVTVQHLPRMSTESAVLADSLSRVSTTGAAERWKIRNALPYKIPAALSEWLANPWEDWSLPHKLLAAVQQSVNQSGIDLP